MRQAILDAFPQDGTGRRLLPLGRSALLGAVGDTREARAALAALLRAREIRAAARRVYWRPVTRQSVLTGNTITVPADPREVALAYAAERGWRTAPGQAASENDIGLSTQVPVRVVLAADGCRSRIAIHGGRIVFEPAPEWVFGQGQMGAFLVQGTRRWDREGVFRFPPAADYDRRGMSVSAVARSVAARATDAFVDGLEADLPRLPKPYRDLARRIVRAARERKGADFPR